MKYRKEQEVYTVAITGSMGSGKSLAVNWFREKGYTTVSADAIGHDLLNDPSVRKEVQDSFGKGIVHNDLIDRQKLGKIVFADRDKLNTLNKIIHPRIIKEIKEFIKSSARDTIILEIPLLFETGIEVMFDMTVNVAASSEIRLQRLMKRDKLSEEELRNRFQSQLSDKIKRELADFTINNDCRVECLYQQLEILDKLLNSMVPE